MHEFGWSDDDYDLLSAGTLVGHIVECGPQCTAASSPTGTRSPAGTTWASRSLSVEADGTAVISKPPGHRRAGHARHRRRADPLRDRRSRRLRDARRRLRLARGRARAGRHRTRSRVAGATRLGAHPHLQGHRHPPRRLPRDDDGDVLRHRRRRRGRGAPARRWSAAPRCCSPRTGSGRSPRPRSRSSAPATRSAPERRNDAATEAVAQGRRAPSRARRRCEIFAAEYAPLGLVAQGMTGFFAGRPRVAPVFRVYHLLAEKADVESRSGSATRSRRSKSRPASPRLRSRRPSWPRPHRRRPPASGVTVPLRRLAYGRSGDKGNNANIGVIARRPEFAAVIARAGHAPSACPRFFAHYSAGPR